DDGGGGGRRGELRDAQHQQCRRGLHAQGDVGGADGRHHHAIRRQLGTSPSPHGYSSYPCGAPFHLSPSCSSSSTPPRAAVLHSNPALQRLPTLQWCWERCTTRCRARRSGSSSCASWNLDSPRSRTMPAAIV